MADEQKINKTKSTKKPLSKSMALFRELRKQRGVSMDAVVTFFKSNDYPISRKTLYGWEGGASNPDTRAFLLLCQFYGVNDVQMFFEDSSKKTDFNPMEQVYLTEHELELIHQYRNTPMFQPAVDKILGVDKKKGL